MKNILLTLSAIMLLGISINTFAESSHEDLLSPDQIIMQIRENQSLTNTQKIDCDKVSNEDLELLGDSLMEHMHPGDAHEFMDEMMGGEGSRNLELMHMQMGASYLGCLSNKNNGYNYNYYPMGGGMMGGYGRGMMGNWSGDYGYGNAGNSPYYKDNSYNMMGSNNGNYSRGGMMGNSWLGNYGHGYGFGFFGGFFGLIFHFLGWIILIAGGVFVARKVWDYTGDKKK